MQIKLVVVVVVVVVEIGNHYCISLQIMNRKGQPQSWKVEYLIIDFACMLQ